MTKVKVLELESESIKHISQMRDGEYGIIVKANNFTNAIGKLVVRIDFTQDLLLKNSKDWSTLYEIGGEYYYDPVNDDIWVKPIEELEIKIVK